MHPDFLKKPENELTLPASDEIQTGRVCGICNRLSGTLLIRNVETECAVYDVYYCPACETGSVVPMPREEDLSALYTSGRYRSAEGKRFNPVIEFFIYLSRVLRKQRIKKCVSGGTLLDIGCGRGLFLDIMQRDGWTVAGVEADAETARDISKARHIPVKSGGPAEWGFGDGSFDVITMNHVLEHLHDPGEMVRECQRLLRKGGLLVCAVPNISSLQASVGKGVWFHLDIPYHIYHFSEAGLVNLLGKHLFRAVQIRRFDIEYGPYGWLQTLLNISGIKKNYLYGLLKNPELRKEELALSRKRDMLLTLVLLPLYFPLSLALSVFESFVLKRGGSVEVFAMKE